MKALFIIIVLAIAFVAVFAPRESGTAICTAFVNAKPVAVKVADAIGGLTQEILIALKKAGQQKNFNADSIVTQSGYAKVAKTVQAKWGRYIDSIALCYGIPAKLVIAKISYESLGKPDTVGKAGEIGLTQMKPTTAAPLGYSRQDLFNPRKNIKAFCQYFSGLKAKRGTDADAIVAYTWGDSAYQKAINLAGCAENVHCYEIVAAIQKTL